MHTQRTETETHWKKNTSSNTKKNTHTRRDEKKKENIKRNSTQTEWTNGRTKITTAIAAYVSQIQNTNNCFSFGCDVMSVCFRFYRWQFYWIFLFRLHWNWTNLNENSLMCLDAVWFLTKSEDVVAVDFVFFSVFFLSIYFSLSSFSMSVCLFFRLLHRSCQKYMNTGQCVYDMNTQTVCRWCSSLSLSLSLYHCILPVFVYAYHYGCALWIQCLYYTAI